MTQNPPDAQSERVIHWAGHSIPLGSLALLLMLVAILSPSVFYSWNLKDQSPPRLLIAICIGMFASVLYLWVLDTTNTVRFRSAWVSRSVYGAAIVSILGTSVGVYKDAFDDWTATAAGEWKVTLKVDSKSLASGRSVVLVHSKSTNVYWGYGARPLEDGLAWIEITRFDPTGPSVELRIAKDEGSEGFQTLRFDLRSDSARSG